MALRTQSIATIVSATAQICSTGKLPGHRHSQGFGLIALSSRPDNLVYGIAMIDFVGGDDLLSLCKYKRWKFQ